MTEALITILNILIASTILFALVKMRATYKKRRAKVRQSRPIGTVNHIEENPEGIIIKGTLKHSTGGKDVYYQTIWADYSSGKISRETTVELLRRK